MAQHRPTRRRGLRGDRPRLPRPRRLEPRARQLLRHRGVLDRLLHARARRARPRALCGRGRRRRRRRALRPRAALSRLRDAPSAVQHGASAVASRVRRGGPATRRRARATRDCRLLRAPGDRAGSAPRRARHAGAAAGLGRADVRAPIVGHAERVHRRRGRLPQRAVCGRARSCARAGASTNRARASARWRTCPSCSSGHRSRRWCSTAPRTTWCCRRSRGRPQPRASTAPDPCSSRAGHFLQWEAADTFNKITAAFCRA